MGKMIGIDLGTTSSCVAVMEGGVPQVIPNQEGQRTTPSYVAFTPDGKRLVGWTAKRDALNDPESTFFGVKRLIGRKFDSDECRAVQRLVPFRIAAAPNGDSVVEARGARYSVPEILAAILGKLKGAAEDYLGELVEEAIVTVPAYFNDRQRQATKDAALIAGLKASRIINEPTAAALAYGLRHTGAHGQCIAVYDLGGGTFDISILEIADGLFQVRATAGDTFLGGDDFDERIMRWLLAEWQRQVGADVSPKPDLLIRFREAAEQAKVELSAAESAEIRVPFVAADSVEPSHLVRTLTRFEYESLTRDLLDHTAEICSRCLRDAGMRPDDIDAVLLVGGQSRAPGVVDLVRRIFGREPSLALNPNESVAMGAAIQTGIIQGEVKDLVLLDVSPHTLGIETKDGTFTPIIERNSTIPTRNSRVFTTVNDGQTRVEVHVLQGESDAAAYNKSLAKFELTNIQPAPKGKPQIEIGFEIDVNGIVSIEATDQATGRRQAMTIHPSSGLDQAEVNRLVDEQRARESGHRLERAQLSTVDQMDGLVVNLLRSVQALEGKLHPEELDAILNAIKAARQALAGAATSPAPAALDQLKPALAALESSAAVVGRAMLRP